MNWWILIAVIPAFLVLDALVIWAIMRFGWRTLPEAFPAREPAPDAVSRRFQSFSVGVMNFGFCINVSVDEHHLHLEPIRPLRWCGARRASIPWEAITVQKPGRLWSTARAGPLTIKAPPWSLELAGGQ